MSDAIADPLAAAIRSGSASIQKRSGTLLSVASIVGGLVLWQVATQGYSRFVLAPPTAVFARLWELTVSLDLPHALGAALGHMVLGFAIACIIAIPLGIAMGRSRFVHDLLDPIVNLIYAVPSVAWAPLIMIWFGLFFPARVVLVVIMCVFDMIIVVSTGLANADRRLTAVGRAFGASRWQQVRLVLLPESLPFVFTALRLGAIRAVNGMITAELFLAAVNLGAIMKGAAVRLDSAAVLGILLVLSVLGLVLQEVLLLAERRLCAWRNEGSRR